MSVFQKPMLFNHFINETAKIEGLTTTGPFFSIKGTKILIKTSQIFNVGDLIAIKGQIVNLDDKNFDFANSYNHYLQSLNIKNLLFNAQITLIKAHQSIYITFKRYLQSFPLLLWFFLGIKIYKYTAIYKMINYLNLAHLFVLSGFHVTVIANWLKKLFNLLTNNYFFKNIITLIILWLLCYILNFNASILRATFMFTFKVFSKLLFNKKYHIIDYWSLSFLIMFVFWPYQIFAFNFVLTFISSLTIYLSTEIIKKRQVDHFDKHILQNRKTKFFRFFIKFLPIFNVYLITLPILIYINQDWNLFGLLINFLFTPFIIIYQLLGIILIWSPFSINFLTILLLEWCKIIAKISINVQLIFLNIQTLINIYAIIFKTLMICKNFQFYHNKFLK